MVGDSSDHCVALYQLMSTGTRERSSCTGTAGFLLQYLQGFGIVRKVARSCCLIHPSCPTDLCDLPAPAPAPAVRVQ